MGNKRKLLTQIDDIIEMVKKELNQTSLKTADTFSGSGIVSRLLKTKSLQLYVNDIAGYSETLNKCYLDTPTKKKLVEIQKYIDDANAFAHSTDDLVPKWVQCHWAPTGKINKKHRVYYTQQNARLIDRYRHYITTIPDEYKPYLLATLLVKSSIHNNTNGQFSAFYKDENGVGKYGGKKEIDIKRITTPIKLEMPILSPKKCQVFVSKCDSNQWVKKIPPVDLMYLDPPYNKHPYSIYYFMLDIINDWNTNAIIPGSNRGQPKNWIKSHYNSFTNAETAFKDLINNIKSKFILLSYNNKGIISIPNIEKILKTRGKLYKFPLTHKTYNKLKGIASYKRETEWSDVKEFMWLVDTRNRTD
jgi:adenine-specific DNA-methyltransferase